MEQKLQKREDTSRMQVSCNHSALWRVLGSTALVLALAGVIVNLPSIKRYIKISTM